MHTFSWTHSLKPQNQDAVGVGENYIAVADGITPMTSGNDEATATACFSTDLMHGLEYYGVAPDTLRAGLTLAILYRFSRERYVALAAYKGANHLKIFTLVLHIVQDGSFLNRANGFAKVTACPHC